MTVEPYRSPTLQARRAQMFPVLADEDIARLRRVGLIEMGAGGPVLIGAPSSPDMARLRNFLARNGIPHLVFDPASDPDAHAFIERYAPRPEDMPLVACPDGSVLRNPGENE